MTSNGRLDARDELGGTGKEAILTCFKVLSKRMARDTE
jgi:hypothetical protein